jgi:hypothetical protein
VRVLSLMPTFDLYSGARIGQIARNYPGPGTNSFDAVGLPQTVCACLRTC